MAKFRVVLRLDSCSKTPCALILATDEIFAVAFTSVSIELEQSRDAPLSCPCLPWGTADASHEAKFETGRNEVGIEAVCTGLTNGGMNSPLRVKCFFLT